MNQVLLTILEKAPILAQLNGYKRIISRVVLVAGTVLPVLQTQFPELAFLPHVTTYVLMVCGWLGLEVGTWHANQKIAN